MTGETAWRRAALLRDRTRQAIRDRVRAGESHASVARDYAVPMDFIEALCAWQFAGDDDGPPETEPVPRSAAHPHGGRRLVGPNDFLKRPR